MWTETRRQIRRSCWFYTQTVDALRSEGVTETIHSRAYIFKSSISRIEIIIQPFCFGLPNCSGGRIIWSPIKLIRLRPGPVSHRDIPCVCLFLFSRLTKVAWKMCHATTGVIPYFFGKQLELIFRFVYRMTPL